MSTPIRRSIAAVIATAVMMSTTFAPVGAAQANERQIRNQEQGHIYKRRRRHGHDNTDAAIAAGILLFGVLAGATAAQNAPPPRELPKDANRGDIRTDVLLDGWTDKNWANSECMRVKEWQTMVNSARETLRRDMAARPRDARAVAFSRAELARRQDMVKRFKKRCKKARLAAN